MNKILVFLAFSLILMVGCKTDSGSTAEVAPSAPVPSSAPAKNEVTPIANPAAAEPDVPVGPVTTVEFEETEFDFGTVMEGEKVTHVYKFKNTGDEPLIISNAKATCGCTVPSWPCLLYTSPSPRDRTRSRMPSSA